MKKNILIDYHTPNYKKYLGNSFPPQLYEFLKNNSNYDVYNLSNRKIDNIKDNMKNVYNVILSYNITL